MSAIAQGSPAIDSRVDLDGIAPELIQRFDADLAALWEHSEGAKLGVAVSGGPDSLALLFLAAASMPDRVEAATVDHGLRAESGDEARFVAEVCDALGIAHAILPVEVDEAGNLQANARGARYAALAKWRDERGLSAIATAHHADDQAETLLMRLNRGSGLAGLSGVRSVGQNPSDGGLLLRPFLGWRKAELESVCEAAGVKPARDPSNEDARFDRVQMRGALAQADWIDPLALAQSAQNLGEAQDYLMSQFQAVYDGNVRDIKGGVAYSPGNSRFENIEIVRIVFARFGIEPTRSELARCVDRLWSGKNASLAGILIRPEVDNWIGFEGRVWHFAPEPPRQSG
ncbi:tRNA lysidine(34) synthetase TilS [Erythrobacter sp. W53]|uniref:tRNA lysidine(34) synthetase TilS n=1 Tax=Erythrobacter sp. W53 TaxID=3425947 RepID=UPI003D76824E